MSGLYNDKVKLDFRGRRMLCAKTLNDDDVWANFLKELLGPVMYLCTSPSLDHDESNITMEEIDYDTVAEDFGEFISESDFKKEALRVWLDIGMLELKTLAELEFRTPDMQVEIVDLTADGDGEEEVNEESPVEREAPVETISSDSSSDSSTSSAASSDTDDSGHEEVHQGVSPEVVVEDSDMEDDGCEPATPSMARDDAIGLHDHYVRHGFINQSLHNEMRSFEEYDNLAVYTHLENFLGDNDSDDRD